MRPEFIHRYGRPGVSLNPTQPKFGIKAELPKAPWQAEFTQFINSITQATNNHVPNGTVIERMSTNPDAPSDLIHRITRSELQPSVGDEPIPAWQVEIISNATQPPDQQEHAVFHLHDSGKLITGSAFVGGSTPLLNGIPMPLDMDAAQFISTVFLTANKYFKYPTKQTSNGFEWRHPHKDRMVALRFPEN